MLLIYKKQICRPVTGLTNNANINSDIIKLFTMFSILVIFYSISRDSIHFESMCISFEPYQASMIGSIAS
jgi:hypothetical protein